MEDNKTKETNLTTERIETIETDQTPIEILLQIDENGETTARKLYDYLQLAKGQFARWSKTNITENEFAEENIDYNGFDIEVEGNIAKDFTLSASFAKKLAMKTHNQRGEQARNYFIKVEDILKQKSKKQQLVLPQDYESALETLLLQVKQNNKLIKQNDELKKVVEEDKPKVNMYERLMNGKNAIDMNDLAKALKIEHLGRNRLFSYLRSKGIFMKNNVPYQKYLEGRGLFKVIFVPVQKGEFIDNVPKTLVTAKGLEYIHNKLKEDNYIKDNE